MKGETYNRVGDALKEQGRSQKWLGMKLGMSQPAINALCRNRTQPSIKKICIIAFYLGLEPGDLVVSPYDNDNPPEN